VLEQRLLGHVRQSRKTRSAQANRKVGLAATAALPLTPALLAELTAIARELAGGGR
jgi:hypothetical protein